MQKNNVNLLLNWCLSLLWNLEVYIVVLGNCASKLKAHNEQVCFILTSTRQKSSNQRQVPVWVFVCWLALCRVGFLPRLCVVHRMINDSQFPSSEECTGIGWTIVRIVSSSLVGRRPCSDLISGDVPEWSHLYRLAWRTEKGKKIKVTRKRAGKCFGQTPPPHLWATTWLSCTWLSTVSFCFILFHWLAMCLLQTLTEHLFVEDASQGSKCPAPCLP